MRVVSSGILKGFITIHTKWAGFSVDDYYQASDSVTDEVTLIPARPLELPVKKGEVDLSGYELVRSEFMSTSGRISIKLSSTSISFSRSCIYKCYGTESVELLIHPHKKIFAVRKASTGSRYSVRWCKRTGEDYYPKIVSGSAFLPTLFHLFGWRSDCNFKVLGNVHVKNGETILFFNMNEAVMILDEDELLDTKPDMTPGKKRKKKIKAYPSDWSDSFGEKYYKSLAEQNEESDAFSNDVTDEHSSAYKVDETNVTSTDEAATHINQILKELGAYDE